MNDNTRSFSNHKKLTSGNQDNNIKVDKFFKDIINDTSNDNNKITQENNCLKCIRDENKENKEKEIYKKNNDKNNILKKTCEILNVNCRFCENNNGDNNLNLKKIEKDESHQRKGADSFHKYEERKNNINTNNIKNNKNIEEDEKIKRRNSEIKNNREIYYNYNFDVINNDDFTKKEYDQKFLEPRKKEINKRLNKEETRKTKKYNNIKNSNNINDDILLNIMTIKDHKNINNKQNKQIFIITNITL